MFHVEHQPGTGGCRAGRDFRPGGAVVRGRAGRRNRLRERCGRSSGLGSRPARRISQGSVLEGVPRETPRRPRLVSPPISWMADPGVSRRRGNSRPPARVLGEVERASAPGGDVPRETCPGRGRLSSPGWESPGVRTGSRCFATVGCDGDSGGTPADLGAVFAGTRESPWLPGQHTGHAWGAHGGAVLQAHRRSSRPWGVPPATAGNGGAGPRELEWGRRYSVPIRRVSLPGTTGARRQVGLIRGQDRRPLALVHESMRRAPQTRGCVPS